MEDTINEDVKKKEEETKEPLSKKPSKSFKLTVFWFSLKFIFVILVGLTIYHFLKETVIMEAYINFLAKCVGFITKFGKADPTVIKSRIIYKINNPETQARITSMTIIPECGAIEAMTIFLASIFSFPASIKKKISGILIAIPSIVILNIIRLGSLGYIKIYGSKNLFDFAHKFIWQTIIIIFIVIIWMHWIERVMKSAK